MLLAFAARPLHAAEVIPPRPSQYVTDNAGVLSRGALNDLNRQLSDFEKQTSNQLLVYVAPKMQSDTDIADYTVRVAKAWAAGQKDRKNGVVLFVFTQDRKIYISVGYGLEGPLPDATCNTIIDNDIKPQFRNNNYDAGIRAGVDSIMKATRGEYKGTGRTRASARSQRGAWIGPVVIMVGIWIFAAWMRRQVRGAAYGSRGVYRRRGWGGGFWPGFYIGGGGGGWSSGGGGSWGGGGGGGGFSSGGGSFGGGGAGGSW